MQRAGLIAVLVLAVSGRARAAAGQEHGDVQWFNDSSLSFEGSEAGANTPGGEATSPTEPPHPAPAIPPTAPPPVLPTDGRHAPPPAATGLAPMPPEQLEAPKVSVTAPSSGPLETPQTQPLETPKAPVAPLAGGRVTSGGDRLEVLRIRELTAEERSQMNGLKCRHPLAAEVRPDARLRVAILAMTNTDASNFPDTFSWVFSTTERCFDFRRYPAASEFERVDAAARAEARRTGAGQ